MSVWAVLYCFVAGFPPALPTSTDDLAAADARILEEVKVPRQGLELLQFLKEMSPEPSRMAEIHRLLEQLGHEHFSERRRAFGRLQALGLVAADALRQASSSDNPEIARSSQILLERLENLPTEAVLQAAIRQLGRSAPPGAFDWLLEQLPNSVSSGLTDAAVWALTSLTRRDATKVAHLTQVLADKEPARRSAAARVLLAIRQNHERVRELLQDPDLTVRWHVAFDLVRGARDRAGVPVLIDLLTELPPNRLHDVDELLRHLAGTTTPDVALNLDASGRRQIRDAWRKWWQHQESQIAWERLDQPPENLGYTLVLQVGLGSTTGDAVEYATDGRTVRWRVKDLDLPIDAQFLDRENRLLVAEYNGNRVTERDLTGRVQQRWAVTQPIMCQRLPNGNTLIAARNQLVEFNPKQEKVFALARPASDIVAAGRTPDGVYVIITRNGVCEQVDAEGKVLRAFNVSRPYHYGSLDLSLKGRLFTTHMNGWAEYDLGTGNQERMISGYRTLTSIQRLANGNLLVCSTSTRRITEFDPQGKVQREIVLEDQIPWRAKRR